VAGAQQGLALPGPAESLVVALGGGQRVADGAALSLGAQAQIHAEDEAVARALGDGARDGLAQARVVLVQAERARLAVVRGVDIDDVDVRREIELFSAQLAHGDDRKTGRGIVAHGFAEARAQLGRAETHRRFEAGVGQAESSRATSRVSPRSGRARNGAPMLALLIQIRTEPARREGLDRNERRGRILDVFNRGVRQRARAAAATATGEFESVVLATAVQGARRQP
jgi:hypothetical protein